MAQRGRHPAKVAGRVRHGHRVELTTPARIARVGFYHDLFRKLEKGGKRIRAAVPERLRPRRIFPMSSADVRVACDPSYLERHDDILRDGYCAVWRLAVSRGANYSIGPDGRLYPPDRRSIQIKLDALLSLLRWLGMIERATDVSYDLLMRYKARARARGVRLFRDRADAEPYLVASRRMARL